MYSRDYRDIAGGLLLVVGGIAFSWFAWEHYTMGSLRRMGPGMFPFGLGVMLAGLGAILTVQAALRPGVLPSASLWSPLFVTAGVIAFAVSIRPLGLIPAICLLVIIASLAELRLRIAGTLALCAGLSLMAWLIFGVGLSLPIAMINWGA